MARPGKLNEEAASVLVADTDRASAMMVARCLTQVGYDVTLAFTGEEALTLLRGGRDFDALVTDLRLYGSGKEPLWCAARRGAPATTILVSLECSEVANVAALLRDGIDDFVVKGAEAVHVPARLQIALVRKHAIEAARVYQSSLERRVAVHADRGRRMFNHFLQVLMQVLEAKDDATYEGSTRVAGLAAALAARLQPHDREFCSQVRVAALFHDIGMVGISDTILHKPGRLGPDEEAEIRRHPEIGERILRPLFEGNAITAMVRSHHEQWNGEGYPDGLSGDETPLGARIVAVADAFGAMISARSHRPALSPEHALHILKDGAGEQWDHTVIEALLALDAAEGVEALLSGDSHEVARAVVAAAPQPAAEAMLADLAPELLSLLTSVRPRRPVLWAEGVVNGEALRSLKAQVEELRESGCQDILLDMHRVCALDADGAESLWLLDQQVRRTGGRIALRDVPESILPTLCAAPLGGTLLFERSPIRGHALKG
uniref:Response regulator n=1 Tax=uncultured Armatimonadetes bacterium TaxID=157466 RepID=A0A6J4J3I9_9BACT|nr:hypothetical protein AVDCRST_MAG63-2728 [uncultured Armatimonadetes bacterium]